MTLTDQPAAGTPAQAGRPVHPGVPAALPVPAAPPAAAAPARRTRSRLTPALLAGDLACAAAVLAAAGPARPGVLVFTLALAVLYGLTGLYRSRLGLCVLDDLPLLLGGAVAALGASTVADVALHVVDVDARLVGALAAQTGLLLAGRAAGYAAVHRARRSGRIAHRTLVVGCGGLGAQLAGILARREHGLVPVGFVDDEPRLSLEHRPLPVLGGIADLPDLVREHGVAVVVVGYSNIPEPVLVDVLRGCHGLDVEIYTVPRFWQIHTSHRLVEVLRGVPVVRLRRPASRASSWWAKRVFDVVASAVGVVVLSPLLLACAVAVRLEGGPGVLFRQERVGLAGRRFQLLKFRSLKPTGQAESATRWSIATDARVGPVGRWLRRLSLDELPQLWNVLRGDMSLVGPRPERPYFVERFSVDHDEYLWRHRVPCGLTGWAQVHGLRGDTSISERARYDNHYIENWSLWLDVKILLRTVVQVVRAAGG
ncbi:hypothetical protein NUM3379_27510 [Kineococcus sp. NUM-3379]